MKNQPINPVTRIAATLLAVFILGTLISCAAGPGTTATPTPAPKPGSASTSAVETPYASYARRDFAAAADGYRAIADDATASAETRRLAYLGNVLVHLSTDRQWRNIGEAGRLLQSAESVQVQNESVEVEMLMNALSSLIGVETNISELNTKVSNSASEIAQLKEERDALEAEQAALNEALEKLKKLTIGN